LSKVKCDREEGKFLCLRSDEKGGGMS
jgi:hypothetical protein